MSFVTSSLLLGVVFVGIPIALHLIMRRQPKHLVFPALQFLRQRQDANRRRLRLRHLLLLALRCLLICLLALALARPSITGSGLLGGGEAPVSAAVIFDTTPRMNYLNENQTRREKAQEFAAWLLQQLPENSEVAVIDSHLERAGFSADVGAAGKRIQRLRETSLARGIPEQLTEALDLLQEGSHQHREIYIFTDLTKSAWTGPATTKLKQRIEEMPELNIYVVDVGVEEAENFGLGEIRLARETLTRNSPLEIAVELQRSGDPAKRAVELIVLEDGPGIETTPRKRGQKTPVWGDEDRIEFRVGGLVEGTHQGYLRIAGSDPLAHDDERFFTVEVKPAWPVLIASGPRAYPQFLAEALAPAAFRKKGLARFETTTIDTVDLGEYRLADYAAVCLLDPPPLSDTLWRQIDDYANSGGSVALFLGHNATLPGFNSGFPQNLLPGLLKRRWRERTYLAPDDYNHPILRRFQSVQSSIPWQSYPVEEYWQLDDLVDGTRVIIPYATGHPALVERLVGNRGRVLTMTTPVSDRNTFRGRTPWNYLPTGPQPNWVFVMLADGMVLHLVGSTENSVNYVAGEMASLRLDTYLPKNRVILTTPSGDNVPQSIDTQTNSVQVTTTEAPGNYRLRGGGTSGVDLGFSVNLATEFSDLERIDEERLAEVLGEDRFRLARTQEEISRDVNVGRVGIELFPYIMVLLALLMAMEHLLANRFYRVREDEAPQPPAKSELVASA